jgi:glycosyltransferase involved in cell wall biosynthesis
MSEWGDIPHNSRHLMRVAHEAGYRVVYIESIGMRRPQLTARDFKKVSRRFWRTLRPLRRIQPRFWVYTPVVIPLHGNRRIERLNARLLTVQLQLLRLVLVARDVILWSYLPQIVPMRRGLRARATIYYRTDDYTSFPHVPREALAAAEANAVREADLCIAAAERYLDGALREARRAIWLPNGVDAQHYRNASESPAASGRPTILMIGTLDSWMDTELLAEVARIRSEWRFALAGPRRTNVDVLLALPNVEYLGVVDYGVLPDVVGRASVGIIPFRLGPVTEGATPGKMYQYLASGKPVVATRFLEPGEFGAHVYLADDNALDFAKAIERALREDSPWRQSERRKLMERHTWRARFESIEAALHDATVVG